MKKLWKIILIIITGAGFVGFLAIGYWYKTEGPAMAIDYNANTEIMCEEPIPVGIAIDKTVDFLDDIYQRYQGETVQNASKQVDALMTAIANGGKICDFNAECKAQVGTAGPDVGLEANAYIWSGRVEGHVPSCKLKEATGNPCPNLDQYTVPGKETSLADLASKLTMQADNVHDLFSVANTPVPFGLEEKGETAGAMISKADLVKRYIDDIDNWLTPNPQKNTCALSELDRKRIEQGKMGDKYPMQCLEALHQEMYVPKAWSETCQDECETFTQECKDCLAKCEGNSVYASLNCKIYSFGDKQGALNKCSDCWFDKTTCLDGETCGKDCVFNKEGSVTGDEYCHSKVQVKIGENPKCAFISGQSKQCCGSVCADGFNTQCKECLCAGEKADQPLSQEKCLDWICGGSKANWVCCHEEPITNPAYYYVNDISPYGGYAPEYYEESVPKEAVQDIFKVTFYSPSDNPNFSNMCRGKCTSFARQGSLPKGNGDIGVDYGVLAVDYKTKEVIDEKTKKKKVVVGAATIQPGSRAKIVKLCLDQDCNNELSVFSQMIEKYSVGNCENAEFVKGDEFCVCDRIDQTCSTACNSGVCTSKNGDSIPCTIDEGESLAAWVDMWLPSFPDKKNICGVQSDVLHWWGVRWVKFEASYDPKDNCCAKLRTEDPMCSTSCKKGGDPVAGW